MNSPIPYIQGHPALLGPLLSSSPSIYCKETCPSGDMENQARGNEERNISKIQLLEDSES